MATHSNLRLQLRARVYAPWHQMGEPGCDFLNGKSLSDLEAVGVLIVSTKGSDKLHEVYKNGLNDYHSLVRIVCTLINYI